MEPKPFRCYDRRYLIESLIVALVLMGLAFAGKPFPAGTAPKIAISVALALVFGFFIARLLLQIRRLDELEQRIHLIAMAIAFGLLTVVIPAIEFLVKAGAPVPRLGLWLLPFMMVAWGVGVVVITRRYR